MTSQNSRITPALSFFMFLATLFAAASSATAQAISTPESTPRELSVATKDTPPFAMKTENGSWTGLAVDLLDEIGRDLGWKIKWTEVSSTEALLKSVTDKKYDAAVAAITITSDREKEVDFSHGYYDSGLAIAVKRNRGASFWSGIEALSSPAFLGTVSLLAGLLLATGAIVWLVERRRNAAQFEENPLKGIGSGFWWAAVTMTTVGYGDKAPVTPVGRLIAVVWMFAALILTAVFTAQLTTTLTLHRLTGPVTSVADLAKSRVGVVENTASNSYFEARAIPIRRYKTVTDGLAALEADGIDAFVHDEPILRYEVRREHLGSLELLPQVFDPKVYGIALQEDSALREEVNRALLQTLASPAWATMKTKYFGANKDGE